MSAKIHLLVEQGATFSTNIDLVDQNDLPLNLTTYTGASQLRKTYTSNNFVAFTVTTGNGFVNLALSATQTANIEAGRYVYDVEVTDTIAVVSRIVEGIVTVTPNVTR